MAIWLMSAGSGVDVSLNYNANNGRVTSMDVRNTNTVPAYAEARLTDGRTFGQRFGPSTTTAINLPNDFVRLTFDADGEPVYHGLAGISLRVPA